MIGSLVRNLMLFLLSVALSTLVWVVAQVEQNPDRTQPFPVDIPVTVTNIPPTLTMTDMTPRAVKVTLRAPQDVWSQMTMNSLQVTADLRGVMAGDNSVMVKATTRVRFARVVDVSPELVTVHMERIISKTVPVIARVVDEPPVGFTLGQTVVSPTELIVSGPENVISPVVEAVADVRIEGARDTIQRSTKPFARDSRGNVIQNAGITPDTVRVTIPVLRLLNFKTVSIRAVISGTVAPGYHITNIVVEPQTVTLNGEASVLERIFSVDTTPVDVSGAQGEVVRAVSAIIPRQTSVDKQADVFVKVSVEPIPGGEVVRRPVVFKGLGKGLRVTSPLTPTVDIQLSGALPDLLAVTPKDITATLDLTDRGPGVYEIPVVVGALPEKLKVVRVTPERFFVIIDRIPP